jgi:hypothetical protein
MRAPLAGFVLLLSILTIFPSRCALSQEATAALSLRSAMQSPASLPSGIQRPLGIDRLPPLITAQRDQGVNSSGALRWNVTGEQGNDRQQERDSGKSDRVKGLHAEQEASHQPRK